MKLRQQEVVLRGMLFLPVHNRTELFEGEQSDITNGPLASFRFFRKSLTNFDSKLRTEIMCGYSAM